jgi:hypothetical protein
MTHTVEIERNGVTLASYSGYTKKAAIVRAKKESNATVQVYISGYNGQCTVYLNPDGNYSSTGKSW